MENKAWVVYLIRCADQSLYCGITNNLQKRLERHGSGKASKYTRSRRPVELIAASSKMSKSDALEFEYRVKQLPSGKKIIELNKGKEERSMAIKKELDKVGKEMRTLTKKLAKLIVDVDRLEKAKALTAKPKAPKKAPRKKPVPKRAPKKAPGKSAKSRPAKKAAARKPKAAKAPAPVSAPDMILDIIRSQGGITSGDLIKQTGLENQKVYNVLYTLKKKGRIRAEGKGLYASDPGELPHGND